MTDIFLDSDEYRIMGSLLEHETEIKMCTKKQNGWYDLLMANRVNVLGKKMTAEPVNSGLIRVRPFILGRRENPINKEWWSVYNGAPVGGESPNYEYDVTSLTDMPLDATWFNAQERVIMTGKDSGLVTTTVWKVVSATVTTATVDGVAGTPVIHVVLAPYDAGSYIPSASRVPPVAPEGYYATYGIAVLRRGTANIQDAESYCEESPAVIPWTETPYWVETTRNSLCQSQNYDEWRKMLLEQNPLYKKWGDLDQIQRNAQQGLDFKKRMVNQFLFGTAGNVNQRIGTYTSLPQVNNFSAPYIDTGGADCYGFKADAIGYFEQMYQCNRVFDAAGEALNMISLFEALHRMIRTREASGTGRTVTSIDVLVPNRLAVLIHQAMITYYKNVSQDQFRMTMDVNGMNLKNADFGFRYRQYFVDRPVGIVLNILTHYALDDELDYATDTNANLAGLGLNVYVMDFADMTPVILDSNEVVHDTQNLKVLAQADATYACVMRLPTRTQRLMSTMWTFMVECPGGQLVIKNVADAVPSVTEDASVVYP